MGGEVTNLQRIRQEHAILRVIIERFRRAAVAARSGGCAQELRDSGRTLAAVLEAHMRAEEDLIKSWCASAGTSALRELHERHAGALEEMKRLRTRGTASYAATGIRLVPHLLEALDSEERELLGDAASVGGVVHSSP